MIQKFSVLKISSILIIAHVYIGKIDCNCPVVDIPASSYPNITRDENATDPRSGNKKVIDAYRWLEDTKSEQTKKFMEAENAISRPYLDKAPERSKIEARLNELYIYPGCYAFFRRGNYYFSFQDDGVKKQYLIMKHKSPTDKGELLFDPNTLSKDGSISVDYMTSTFSDDGMMVAYLVQNSNSDWYTVRFQHVEKGWIYKETLTGIQSTLLSFSQNSTGLFYSGYGHEQKRPPTNPKLYYHQLGTDQCKDIVVAEFPKTPTHAVFGQAVNEGKYLVVTVKNPKTGNCLVYVADLAKICYQITGKLNLTSLITKEEAGYEFVAAFNTTFVFETDLQAENFKVISIDMTDVKKSWKELVPEDKENELNFSRGLLNKYLVLSYTVNKKGVLQIHDINSGKLIKKLDTEFGWIATLECTPYHSDFYFTIINYFTPSAVYQCDASTSFDIKMIYDTKLKNFDREKVTIEVVSFKGNNGAQLPMILAHKKDLQMNANNPVLMKTSAGYQQSLASNIEISVIMWVSNFGGIYAQTIDHMANYDNYKQPHNKPNVIADFKAAAEFLIAQKYTTSKLISVYADTGDAPVVCACVNQNPGLFGAIVTNQGILDLLRIDKTPFKDIAKEDFGDPNNPKDYPIMLQISPLHNINMSTAPYPAILSIAGVSDEMPVWNTLKYTATLQYEAKNHTNQKGPFITALDTSISTNKPAKSDENADQKKDVAKYTDTFSFISLIMGIKFNPQC